MLRPVENELRANRKVVQTILDRGLWSSYGPSYRTHEMWDIDRVHVFECAHDDSSAPIIVFKMI